MLKICILVLLMHEMVLVAECDFVVMLGNLCILVVIMHGVNVSSHKV